MTGIKYLLDTNFIIGLLKSSPDTLAVAERLGIEARQCGYNAITRMELLGFPGMSPNEEALIQQRLKHLTYLPLTPDIEDMAIKLRRKHAIKLPDAIIAACSLVHGSVLLTHDQKLLAVMEREVQA